MKIIEALDRIDALKSNIYPHEEKVKWLNQLDASIYRELVATHEDAEDCTYDPNTPYTMDMFDTELIAPAPYEEMYLDWLEAKIDYYNGELTKYNNSIARYNDMYFEFSRWYNRNHMPLGKKIRYW